jgi:hypothetical protein
MLSLILAAALQAGAPAVEAGADPARPPASPPVTVEPVTAEAPIVYGVVEGRGQPKPKRVCFKDPTLGSKIPTKRCMDREEFERRQAESRDYVRRIQSDAQAPKF